MILKPFMLRRVKTEVENELSDKIEIMTYCPLTLRQKYLYNGLKNKISIEELLNSSVNNQSINSVTTSLMNLVMQFRKVCNHPELLERREVKSPLIIIPEPYILPKLVYREGLLQSNFPSQNHLLYNRLNIFNTSNIHSSLQEDVGGPKCFSFLRFIDTSPEEISKQAIEGYLCRWISLLKFFKNCLLRHLRSQWQSEQKSNKDFLLLDVPMGPAREESSELLKNLVFTSAQSTFYAFKDHVIHNVPENNSEENLRTRRLNPKKFIIEDITDVEKELDSFLEDSSQEFSDEPVFLNGTSSIKQESRNLEVKPKILRCQPTRLPSFLFQTFPKTHAIEKLMYCSDKSAYDWQYQRSWFTRQGVSTLFHGSLEMEHEWKTKNLRFRPTQCGGVTAASPKFGWNRILIPDKHTLIMDAGKLYVLDSLLSKLKYDGHRVLIYSQMTKMIDLLEEYMWYKKYKYIRLDGSSKISDRRDMVENFQNKSDIFVFLLSTRAGGVGINLTAADTVIFYDSDWNPTVDQQAMDRAHRLGQTKQVTVYRLICKSTIEERILQRAREKSEIQRMVISGGNFKLETSTLKPKEVVSLLLDDDIEREYKAKQAKQRAAEDYKLGVNREKMRERMRKRYAERKLEKEQKEKRRRLNDSEPIDVCGDFTPTNSSPASPRSSEDESMEVETLNGVEDDVLSDSQSTDVKSSSQGETSDFNSPSDIVTICGQRGVVAPSRRVRKRGRPKGSSVRAARPQRDSTASEATSGTVDSETSSTGTPPMTYAGRRGRGRPRMGSMGPNNQGLRSTPGLPIALGSTLDSNLTISSNKAIENDS